MNSFRLLSLGGLTWWGCWSNENNDSGFFVRHGDFVMTVHPTEMLLGTWTGVQMKTQVRTLDLRVMVRGDSEVTEDVFSKWRRRVRAWVVCRAQSSHLGWRRSQLRDDQRPRKKVKKHHAEGMGWEGFLVPAATCAVWGREEHQNRGESEESPGCLWNGMENRLLGIEVCLFYARR